MTSPLGPAALEAEILRLSARLEEQTDEFARKAVEEARAKHAYKIAYGQAYLRAVAPNIPERQEKANQQVEDLALAAEIAEAVAKAALESCRSIRQQLSAVQSVGAMFRAQMELGRSA